MYNISIHQIQSTQIIETYSTKDNYEMYYDIKTITGVVFISANNKIYGKNKHDMIATNEKFTIRSWIHDVLIDLRLIDILLIQWNRIVV